MLRLGPRPPELSVAVIVLEEGPEVLRVQTRADGEHGLHHLDVLDHVRADLENVTVGEHLLNLTLVIFPFTLAYICHRKSLIKFQF